MDYPPRDMGGLRKAMAIAIVMEIEMAITRIILFDRLFFMLRFDLNTTSTQPQQIGLLCVLYDRRAFCLKIGTLKIN